MPNNTLRYLSFGCVALIATYLVLIVATLFFAGVQSGLTEEIQERESAVAALETEYYDTLAALTGNEYLSVGLVSPLAVQYVQEGGDTAVTRLDR